MKTTTKTVTELIETKESPLPLEVIPNNMGINLCSVDALTWTRQDDGQLVSLTIHFVPAPNTAVSVGLPASGKPYTPQAGSALDSGKA